ncbi:MAG: hypothetical protein V4677_08670 [Bacteroidota bacterium]
MMFDFDSTKVYITHSDLKTVLTADNKKFGDSSRLIFNNDTLVLKEHWLDDKQHLDSLAFELQKELFALINQKKGTIHYHQQPILSFYTRKVTYRTNSRICFIGLDYIDKTSKQVFLIQTLYQRPHCNFGVKF